MSRSGYSCDLNNWELIRYRGQVASAIRGQRGQKFLKDALTILDAMPEKELAKETLKSDGQFCVVGAVLQAKGLPIPDDDDAWGDPTVFSNSLGVAWQLLGEIIFENDEYYWLKETPAERWQRMRRWIAGKIIPAEEVA